MQLDGTDAARRAVGAADCHPLSVRCAAPATKRMQRKAMHGRLRTRPPAADPQPRYNDNC